jgi:Fur family ferric uptake transcriptional regulator
MKDASKKIITELTARGYRITKARTEVLETLAKTHSPLSIQAITEAVTVDVVSVYRTVAMLKNEHLVEEINIQGEVTLYEIAHGHHHHAVCTSCSLLVHVSCEAEQKTPKHIPGFTSIDSHEVTYYGICAKCS